MLSKLKSISDGFKSVLSVIALIITSLLFYKARNSRSDKKEKNNSDEIKKSEGRKEILNENLSENNNEIKSIDEEIKKREVKLKLVTQEENSEDLDDFFDKRGF
jgi:uncharacterized membrane protein YhiD involved in acid resistance